MYWYLSFLRPPPVSAHAGGSITITPQIANDLRTEVYSKQQDIYYGFAKSTPKWGSAEKPKLLTRWNPPQSTYAPITIPLPDSAQPGEKWRLYLSCSKFDFSDYLEGYFEIPDDGEEKYQPSPKFITVSSEGIEILPPASSTNGSREDTGEAKAKKVKRESEGVAKQQRIERAFSWRFDRPSQGTIYLLEQTSFDLDKVSVLASSTADDKKLWDSGFALGMWLWKVHWAREDFCEEAGYEWLKSARGFVEKLQSEIFWGDGPDLNVLELGSGTGFVSICFATIWEDVSQHGIDKELTISATDLPSAIGLLKENIKGNKLSLRGSDPAVERGAVGRGKDAQEVKKEEAGVAESSGFEEDEEEQDRDGQAVRAKVLDWDRPLPEWVGKGKDGEASWPDLIIAADVTYNTDSFPSLVKTLVSLLKPSDGKNRPQLLLAYKERDPGERELWPMLKAEGIKMVKIDTMRGAEDYGEVEIWLGSAAEKKRAK